MPSFIDGSLSPIRISMFLTYQGTCNASLEVCLNMHSIRLNRGLENIGKDFNFFDDSRGEVSNFLLLRNLMTFHVLLGCASASKMSNLMLCCRRLSSFLRTPDTALFPDLFNDLIRDGWLLWERLLECRRVWMAFGCKDRQGRIHFSGSSKRRCLKCRFSGKVAET